MKRKFSLLLLLFGSVLAFNTSSYASKTCWCWIGPQGSNGWVNQGDPVKWKDFGGIETYPNITTYNKKTKCSAACAKKAADSGILANKTSLCALAGRNISPTEASKVGAFSLVGAGDFGHEVWDYDGQPSNFLGCTNTCTCPSGWLPNPGGQEGGVTTDGACKKKACQAISIIPLPPNGTQLGTWGFSWGNALFAWGTSQNGGKASCVMKPN